MRQAGIQTWSKILRSAFNGECNPLTGIRMIDPSISDLMVAGASNSLSVILKDGRDVVEATQRIGICSNPFFRHFDLKLPAIQRQCLRLAMLGNDGGVSTPCMAGLPTQTRHGLPVECQLKQWSNTSSRREKAWDARSGDAIAVPLTMP